MTACGYGEIGPVNIWKGENSISSFDPSNGGYQTSEACIRGKYSEETVAQTPSGLNGRFGVIQTEFLKVIGPKLEPGRWNYLWSDKNPLITDPRFELLFTAQTLEKYISDLKRLNVYRGDLTKVLIKEPPIEIEVGLNEEMNAAFNPFTYSIFFGNTPGVCSFGGDGDVVIHEFEHLLTHSTNPELSMQFGDIEAGAVNESISDLSSAFYFNDPEVGEFVGACLGVVKTPGPDQGLRRVNLVQGELFHDTEEHNRTEIYSPILWIPYERMLQRAAEKAPSEEAFGKRALVIRELMIMLVHNIRHFLPASPTGADFVRAIYNGLFDLLHRPELPNIYRMDVGGFLKDVIDTARFRRAITEKDVTTITSLYPYVDNAPEMVARLSSPQIELKESYRHWNMIFYQQYFNGAPVLGGGVKFILVSNAKGRQAVQMIDMRADPARLAVSGTIASSAKAWNGLKSEKASGEVAALLSKEFESGLLQKRGLEELTAIFEKLRRQRTPNSRVVYLKGKSNPHYEYNTNGLAIYIDATNGSVSLGKKSFH